jgi:hypothetical protein
MVRQKTQFGYLGSMRLMLTVMQSFDIGASILSCGPGEQRAHR